MTDQQNQEQKFAMLYKEVMLQNITLKELVEFIEVRDEQTPERTRVFESIEDALDQSIDRLKKGFPLTHLEFLTEAENAAAQNPQTLDMGECDDAF